MARAKTPPTLRDLAYVSIADGYFFGDSVAPQHGGPSAKYLYLDLGKKFLKTVHSCLVAGAESVMTKVSINPGGPAIAGDVSLSGEVDGWVVHVTLVYDMTLEHAKLYWRLGKRALAVDGVNIWIESPAATSSDVADAILRGVAAMKRSA